jgi:hypothetical protein
VKFSNIKRSLGFPILSSKTSISTYIIHQHTNDYNQSKHKVMGYANPHFVAEKCVLSLPLFGTK